MIATGLVTPAAPVVTIGQLRHYMHTAWISDDCRLLLFTEFVFVQFLSPSDETRLSSGDKKASSELSLAGARRYDLTPASLLMKH